MKILTDEEFMDQVKKLAETNVVVAAMVKSGEGKWPRHLREELMDRLNVRQVYVQDPTHTTKRNEAESE